MLHRKGKYDSKGHKKGLLQMKKRRPYKCAWILVRYSYCHYMQWLLDLDTHFTDFWRKE